jgi:hypothetical protein
MTHTTYDAHSERLLWQAVAEVALLDAAKGKDADWVASPDADIVFSLADLDPEAIRTRLVIAEVEAVLAGTNRRRT